MQTNKRQVLGAAGPGGSGRLLWLGLEGGGGYCTEYPRDGSRADSDEWAAAIIPLSVSTLGT